MKVSIKVLGEQSREIHSFKWNLTVNVRNVMYRCAIGWSPEEKIYLRKSEATSLQKTVLMWRGCSKETVQLQSIRGRLNVGSLERSERCSLMKAIRPCWCWWKKLPMSINSLSWITNWSNLNGHLFKTVCTFAFLYASGRVSKQAR